MKVLMVARDTVYSSPGGDTTQIKLTAKYLRTFGVEVDIVRAGELRINYNEYDLIHFFNIIRPDDILPHIKKNTPYVVSTVFVDFSEYDKKRRKGLSGLMFRFLSVGKIEYLKTIGRFLLKGDKLKSGYYILFGQAKSIKYIAKRAAFFLPNSHSEFRRFSNFLDNTFGYKSQFPYLKIVNAVDPTIFDINVPANPNFEGHVLCVGRIEGIKNQLNLIRAISTTGLKLAIVGKPALNQQNYYRECLKASLKCENIRFVEHVNHAELASIYKAAKVHVLPSWFETTGLSSLEAGVMGCNIVITRKGDTEEYFKDMAYYCDPDDILSIREAILKAYNAPVDERLRQFILENYTWEKAACQTLEGYKSALQ